MHSKLGLNYAWANALDHIDERAGRRLQPARLEGARARAEAPEDSVGVSCVIVLIAPMKSPMAPSGAMPSMAPASWFSGRAIAVDRAGAAPARVWVSRFVASLL